MEAQKQRWSTFPGVVFIDVRIVYIMFQINFRLKVNKKMIDELEYLKKDYQIEAVLLKDEIAINPKKDLFLNQIDALGNSG